ncbi:MAG: GyrI-like domain-containing protein [Verrucomicrobia bacterium]|nr:GyrI-like domain-containing protein [Verrucomicrobiota bacterium]
MKRTTIEKPEIQLVGISIRTSYEKEVNKETGAILPCVMRYFHEALFDKIPHRKKPGTTFCAYTEYESDYRGAYTYFIGEEVSSPSAPLPEGFQKLIIPAQTYVQFTTSPAPMPEVIIDAWTSIWKMSPQELGGDRVYHTDFEIYDERAADHQRIVMDVCVGIKKFV